MECPYCSGKKFQLENISSTEKSEPKDSSLYSRKMETLIDMALSDGELTEKEKQVLFKNAELEGIDLDEFEMILDAKLSKIIKKERVSNLNTQSSSGTVSDHKKRVDLDNLIDIAFVDGIISQQEKEVLTKKAISLGIDIDEFQMILESKALNKQKINESLATPKSNKLGDIRKCPACGAIAESFQTSCSDCSHEFSNIAANVSIGKLFEMLNEVESKRKQESDGGFFGSFSKKLSDTYTNNLDAISKSKIEIIKNFPIPTTKNDILEFLILALPNAKKAGSIWTANQPEVKLHNEFVPVWKSKCEQIIMKAKFSMKEDKKTLDEIMAYANELGIQ
jgi:uncharacterized tellurite resistance protein B-like protein